MSDKEKNIIAGAAIGGLVIAENLLSAGYCVMRLFFLALSIMVTLTGLEAAAAEVAVDIFVAHKTIAREALYEGKTAILVQEPSGPVIKDEDKLLILKDILFKDGEIEVWVSGERRKDAFKEARGYVGLAFRISKDITKFEAIYLRPENGRSDNQLRRNHAIQYMSYPEYPWSRLRHENPSKYEAYADMESGKWVKYRLVVKEEKAKLYLNDNSQPSLIINDLKHGRSEGAIGFWIGPGTTAYFSGLKISE